jgi:hypothetical protein
MTSTLGPRETYFVVDLSVGGRLVSGDSVRITRHAKKAEVESPEPDWERETRGARIFFGEGTGEAACAHLV